MDRSASCAAVGMAEIERKVEQVCEPQTGGLARDTEQGTDCAHFVLKVSLNRLEEGCGNAFLNRVSQIQPEVNSKQGNSG